MEVVNLEWKKLGKAEKKGTGRFQEREKREQRQANGTLVL